MTKSDLDFIGLLVKGTNRHIEEVYSGTALDFMTHDQRIGYIQGVTAALKPFAILIGMEVVSVDLNNM